MNPHDKLSVYMVFVFIAFVLCVFAVCSKEIRYYIHRVARKFKLGKKKKTSRIAYEEETSATKKPDKMKFVGKLICCLPVLIIYGYSAMFLSFSPEGGYTEDSIESVFISMVSAVVVSLLCVIIGLLLCCYSRLRKNAHDIEEIHAYIELQQAREKDADDLNRASVIDFFDRKHPDEDS